MHDFWMLGAAVGVAVVLAPGWFGYRRARDERQAEKDRKAVAAMEREIETDGIDDNSPVLRDIVQAARDKGAV